MSQPSSSVLSDLVDAGKAPEAGRILRGAIVEASGNLARARAELRIGKSTIHRHLHTLPGELPGQTCREWMSAAYPRGEPHVGVTDEQLARAAGVTRQAIGYRRAHGLPLDAPRK